MSNKLNLSQKALCNKIGKMFELASLEMHCYEISFCKAWLLSNLCQEIAEMEVTLICQSKNYLLNSFKRELSVSFYDNYLMDSNAMYWMGYILTYWIFLEDVDGRYIVNNYNLKGILEQYDVLHTMSVKAAIKTIKEDYRK